MKLKKEEIDHYLKAKLISEALTDRVIDDNRTNDYEIGQWLNEDVSAAEVLKAFSDEEKLMRLYAEYDEVDANKEKDVAVFKERISSANFPVKHRPAFIYKISATIAAALAIASFLVYNVNNRSYLLSESTAPKIGPILIMSDGKSIDLRESGENNLIEKIAVVNSKKEVLNYASQSTLDTVSSKVEYNTIVIPEQYNYKVILGDSTEVILNANSELKYPTRFTGENREVFLKGEAFFNVKKGATPFIVNSYDVAVKVYGTRFNVNANNPHIIKTALISGSVGVSIEGVEGEIMLKPNQMAVTNLNLKKSEICDIESERYLAWTSGYFRYDSDKLEEILEELSVWYNVDFIFDDSVKSVMTGSFEKSLSLESILLSIEDATNVKFTKEGGHYRVNQKQ